MFKTVTVIVVLVISVCGIFAADSLCGVKEPDEKKTCISIRLPWQEQPIHFCTENENIRYKDRCNDRLARYCPNISSNKTLLVATPWDCCALTSTPDYCADRHCPAAPFNRTCTEIVPDSHRPWDCCSSFYCEEGKMSNCQMKKLQPGCMSPPKGKSNCVAFKDEHGCCNKYQCENEGKPGMCPKQAEAVQLQRMIEDMSTSSSGAPIIRSSTMSSIIDGMNNGTVQSFHKHSHITTDMRCVGDYNCPGEMKCCSQYMGTYIKDTKSLGNRYDFGYQSPDQSVYGYCMEPMESI